MTLASSGKRRDRDHKDPEDPSKTLVYPGMGKDHSGVYPRKHGVGIWGNRRVPMTVRVDEGLKKAFLSFCQRVFGSSCLPLEGIMAGVIGAVVEVEKRGIYPSATVPLKLDVGKILIQRNFKTRRKMVEEETEVTEEIVVAVKCGFCEKAAVARFRHVKSGKEMDACRFHAESLRGRKDWVEVKA